MIINKSGIIIDLNNPECLFCRRQIDSSSGFGESLLSCDLYVCNACKEGYTLGFIKDSVSYIIFTCKNIEVIYYINNNYFEIKNFWSLKSKVIKVPAFDLDFSNKENLLKKLSTYIIFS